VAHVALLIAFIYARPPLTAAEPAAMVVALIDPPRPPPEPPPTAPTPTVVAEAPARPSPRPRPAPWRHIVQRPPPLAQPVPVSQVQGAGVTTAVEVGDGDLAGAATAASGRGSSACNMAQRLQDALRKDRMVAAAVAQADRGKAIMVWNGDWVRHPGQDGNGLAAVREAILWEVGFAPAACRNERVQGLVILSMNDSPDASRLVVGAGAWRWSDLLGARARR